MNYEKWIEALRSGEYEQTTGVLRNEKGYCCLGVLCDIYNKETGEGGWIQYAGDGYSFNGLEVYPPDEVCRWTGMENIPSILSLDGETLIGQNDGGVPFNEIADVIERHFKEQTDESKRI